MLGFGGYPNWKSTYNLLRGLRELRGLISAVLSEVTSTLNLQVWLPRLWGSQLRSLLKLLVSGCRHLPTEAREGLNALNRKPET